MEVLAWSKELIDARVSWEYVCCLRHEMIKNSGYIRSLQISAINGLVGLIECDDGFIREAAVKDLRFKREEETE